MCVSICNYVNILYYIICICLYLCKCINIHKICIYLHLCIYMYMPFVYVCVHRTMLKAFLRALQGADPKLTPSFTCHSSLLQDAYSSSKCIQCQHCSIEKLQSQHISSHRHNTKMSEKPTWYFQKHCTKSFVINEHKIFLSQ